jgi:hypothetical protein
MLLEGGNFFTYCDIPKFDGLVPTSRSNGFAIGTETDATDPIVMPLEGGNFFACGDIPEFDGLVSTARSNGFAIGTETDTND